MNTPPLISAAALVLASLPALPQSIGGASGVTEHASMTGAGAVSSASSWAPNISDDGRWVAFHSFAALLPEDTNGWSDIYAFDRWTDTLVGVSVEPGGVAFGNAPSYHADISADGRYVAYESRAANLVPLDFNTWPDVYVMDLQTGINIRVSNTMGGAMAANGGSEHVSISDDGRYVAFKSGAADLVLPDTNNFNDIFRYDTLTGAMVRVSDGPGGQADDNNARPNISGDGSRITWESWASNLIAVDVNGVPDIFVTDVGGLPQLVSRSPAGVPANGASGRAVVSSDGQFVAFNSWASDIAPVTAALNVFRMDVATLQVELVSQSSAGLPGDDNANAPALSADGRYVAFQSGATNLAPFDGPDWDAFLRDMDVGRTWTIGRASGVVGVADSSTNSPDLNADGTIVTFESQATTLVPGVNNVNQGEVYVRTVHPDPRAYCTSSITSAGCQPSLSALGYSSLTAVAGFSIEATDVPNQRLGLLFYGLAGPASKPFGGATLCVAGPKRRTPPLQSGGNPPAADDCSGSYSLDMNAFAAGALGGNPHAALGLVGQQVNAQVWGRDAASASGVFLSDALEYVVGP
jgi:Tol biopolymer transport system component